MLSEGRMSSQMKEIRVRVGIERENCVRLDCTKPYKGCEALLNVFHSSSGSKRQGESVD